MATGARAVDAVDGEEGREHGRRRRERRQGGPILRKLELLRGASSQREEGRGRGSFAELLSGLGDGGGGGGGGRGAGLDLEGPSRPRRTRSFRCRSAQERRERTVAALRWGTRDGGDRVSSRLPRPHKDQKTEKGPLPPHGLGSEKGGLLMMAPSCRSQVTHTHTRSPRVWFCSPTDSAAFARRPSLTPPCFAPAGGALSVQVSL